GASDTPYVIRQAMLDRRISWPNKLTHIFRQIDDYLTWATAPIILSIGGWLPYLLQPTPHRLILADAMLRTFNIMQFLAIVWLVVAIYVYFALLPPRPAHVGPVRSVSMMLQWLLEPVALVSFISIVSLMAHGRLVLGKPLEKFNVTAKTTAQDS